MSAQDLKVINFGCRLNAAESEMIYNNLYKAGISNTIVFNGCSVTAEAERKLKQSIRKARRNNPNTKILLTGCPASNRRKVYESMQEVDEVIDNLDKIAWSKRILNSSTKSTQLKNSGKHTRIFLPIQNGCDHSCTFCIIPQGRGLSRSVEFNELVKQITDISKEVKEIVLTGVDITAYGNDLKEKINLGILCEKLLDRFPDIPRWRLSSIDSAEIDQNLLSLIASENRIMPHIHLSIQSGSNIILKRMKRRHLRPDIISLINDIKSKRKDVVFGADIIVGFPTENEDNFQESLSMVKSIPIHWLHVFPYSARPNTPASRMPQVNQAIIKERSRTLRKLSFELIEKFAIKSVGQSQQVLIEADGRGFTPHFLPVRIDDAKKEDIGKVNTVLLKSWDFEQQIMNTEIIK